MEYALSNATIFAGENLDPLEGHSVLIENKKVKAVVPSTQLPEDIEQVDYSGKYIFPGLIDAHLHLVWDGQDDPVITNELENDEQKLIRSVANYQQYAKNGITTIRDLGSINDISIHIAQARSRGLLTGAKLIAAGRSITMTGGHDPFWARFIDGADEAVKVTRDHVYRGAGVIKISATGGVYGREEGEVAERTELQFDEIKAIVEIAHHFGIQVASHAIGREGILNSVRAGVDTIEHGNYMDAEIIDEMVKHGTAWVPTIKMYDTLAHLEGVPQYAQDKAQIVTALHRDAFRKFYKDVPIAAGSDAGSVGTPHPSIFGEIKMIAEDTGDTLFALQSATVNPGRILHQNVGQITAGFDADLIVLDADPTQNLEALRENLVAVYLEGKEFTD